MDDKVKEWVEREGYPLEFSTAHKFKNKKFSVEQGSFVKDKSGKAREIDVLATMNIPYGKSFLRIKQVVECKWSKDKPWVLFKDEARFAPSALVAQLISSVAGQALTWTTAGNEDLRKLDMFMGTGFCFSGRQAFSKGNDLFYQAVQGVVSNCINVVREYDEYNFKPDVSMLAVIAMPIIVISGDLFEATYDSQGDELKLNRITHARLRWTGNEERHLNTVVDIVTSEYLDEFLDTRRLELEILAKCLGGALQQLIKCFKYKTREFLVITEGPRGISGMPELLWQLDELSKATTSLPSDTP